jgi:hypothetical protein
LTKRVYCGTLVLCGSEDQDGSCDPGLHNTLPGTSVSPSLPGSRLLPYRRSQEVCRNLIFKISYHQDTRSRLPRQEFTRPSLHNATLPCSCHVSTCCLFTDKPNDIRDRQISEHILRMHRYLPAGVEEGNEGCRKIKESMILKHVVRLDSGNQRSLVMCGVRCSYS